MNRLVPYHSDLATIALEATRDGFGKGLIEVAELDERVVGLCADLTESIRLEAFSKQFPDRFFEVGVAEQNMMGIAAGLALSGKIPFLASYAVFNPGRNWDQLRVSVAYSQANVKIIGAHAGISVGPDGATHQALEDIAITRVLPQLTVVVPTDQEEARKAVHALVAHQGPVYMRFGRDKSASLTTELTPFQIGKANQYTEGNDVTICANGLMVYEALQAAEILQQKKIRAEVWAFHTVKPLDKEALLSSVQKTGAVVTAEEAQITGGLGAAVAEFLSETLPVPVVRVGVADRFAESGTPAELMDAYGLRARNIVQAAEKALNLKS